MKHLRAALAVAVTLLVLGSAGADGGDSLRYLLPGDTVMLEITPTQRKFTRHVFAPKQTVYSLSRFYGQDLEQVYALNPGLASGVAGVGDTVRIGVPNFAINRFRKTSFSESDFARVCYRVNPGETVYHIARTIFRMPVDTLLTLNGLAGPTLQPGQVLQVGWLPVAGVADRVQPQRIDPLMRVNYRNFKQYEKQADHPSPVRGVATWMEGSGEASGSLFALSEEAEAGTFLKITNAANKKVAYVRVIGRPAPNVRRERVALELSGTAARVLAATERNFYVLIE